MLSVDGVRGTSIVDTENLVWGGVGGRFCTWVEDLSDNVRRKSVVGKSKRQKRLSQSIS